MKKLKIAISFICLVILTLTINAQVVTGIVVDESNSPMVAANIIVPETSNVHVTDYEGKFSFTIGKANSLEFRYLGYRPHKIFNLPLTKDTINLGKIQLVDLGIICSGIGRRRAKQKYVLDKKILEVHCDNAGIRYTRIYKDDETFELDYKKITRCIN